MLHSHVLPCFVLFSSHIGLIKIHKLNLNSNISIFQISDISAMSLMMSSELAITPNQDKEVKDPDGNSYTNNIQDPHHF